MQLPFLREKSGAIALVLPGITAGWLAGIQAGRQSSVKFKNFLNYIPDETFNFLLHLTKARCYYSCTNRF